MELVVVGEKITVDVNKVLYISDGCWAEFNIY